MTTTCQGNMARYCGGQMTLLVMYLGCWLLRPKAQFRTGVSGAGWYRMGQGRIPRRLSPVRRWLARRRLFGPRRVGRRLISLGFGEGCGRILSESCCEMFVGMFVGMGLPVRSVWSWPWRWVDVGGMGVGLAMYGKVAVYGARTARL